MNRYIQVVTGVFMAAVLGTAYGNEPDPATVQLHDQGFRVEAPSGASMLEVRLMGPQRTVLFESRTTGGPIDWTLSGGEGDGDYRYEAVVVMDIGGVPQQRNRPGGFEVKGGRVMVPAPVTTEALME